MAAEPSSSSMAVAVNSPPPPTTTTLQRLLASTDEQCNPFYGAPLGRLTACRVVVQGIVLVPVKLVLAVVLLLCVWAVSAVATCGARDYVLHEGRYRVRAPGRCRSRCARRAGRCGARGLMYLLGVWWISAKRTRGAAAPTQQPDKRRAAVRRYCCGCTHARTRTATEGSEERQRVAAATDAAVSAALALEAARVQPPTASGGAQTPGVVIANHTGLLDSLALLVLEDPVFISKAPVARFPFIGTITKSWHTVFVERGNVTQKQLVLEHMRQATEARRADGTRPGASACLRNEPAATTAPTAVVVAQAAPVLPTAATDANASKCATPALASLTAPQAVAHHSQRVFALFPEGTTTNGELLIQFRAGCFRLGCPVKPVLVRHPYRWFSPCWTMQGLVPFVFGLFSQVYNCVLVDMLDTQVPTQSHLRDPIAFANHVRGVMAAHSGMSVCDYSFKDGLAYFHELAPSRRHRKVAPAPPATAVGDGTAVAEAQP